MPNLRVKTGYLTAFLLLLISYFFIFIALQQFLKQTKWVEHTDLVINYLETLSSYTNEAEGAARGYALLNDTDHLQTFNAATKRIDQLLKNVDSLTQDSPTQRKRADSLKMLLLEKLERMHQTILLYQQANNTATEEMKLHSVEGKKLAASIKNTIYQMEVDERNLLRLRKEKLSGVFVSIKIITITSLVIALLLSAYSFITYSKESDAKSRADEQAASYRKQLENKVNELQAANAELQELRSIEKFAATGRIARTIAHEVRNPLTNIILATDQIKSTLNGNEQMTMLLDMINRNANRINLMISELLTSTKFSQLHYSKTPISSLLDETLELAKDRIELKHIKLEKNYVYQGCEVFVDIEKMKIALLNIIVNAIEAMEKEMGVLTIKTSHKNDKCFIDISDNGAGMTEETLQKMFDPYFTNKSAGNGLGLTNTQNIILNHKGTIQVKSEEGKGSIFTIILNID